MWLLRNDFAADPARSVSEADRRVYTKAHAQPGGMRAGFEYFKSFERDAQDFQQFAQTKLTMPMLVLIDEAPRQVIPALVEFIQ